MKRCIDTIDLRWVCWASVFIFGCGQSPAIRQAIHGTVTVEQQTDLSGNITFFPNAGGPAASTTIDGGRYQFDSADGPLPGDYRVLVELNPDDPEMNTARQPSMTHTSQNPGGKSDLLTPNMDLNNPKSTASSSPSLLRRETTATVSPNSIHLQLHFTFEIEE